MLESIISLPHDATGTFLPQMKQALLQWLEPSLFARKLNKPVASQSSLGSCTLPSRGRRLGVPIKHTPVSKGRRLRHILVSS